MPKKERPNKFPARRVGSLCVEKLESLSYCILVTILAYMIEANDQGDRSTRATKYTCQQ